jgi:hypothetical protein
VEVPHDNGTRMMSWSEIAELLKNSGKTRASAERIVLSVDFVKTLGKTQKQIGGESGESLTSILATQMLTRVSRATVCALAI